MTTTTTQTNDIQSKLKKITSEALETLCQSLDAGKSDELVRYLDTMAKFPRYSLRNLFLIMAQMPSASQVMGYQSWQKLNRQVRKGEKAICIRAPLIKNKRGGADSQKNSQSKDSTETLIFRPVAVFDISQTKLSKTKAET